jgi:uncharacterized OsmC-like protein
MAMSVRATNGVDVAQLTQTIEAIKEDPGLATFTWRARSRWNEGTYNIGQIHGFRHAGGADESRAAPFILNGDEPPVLLGGNRGANALELMLQALAFCYSVGFAVNAAARGIEITRMEYEVEGDFDVRAFLGLEGPRPGLTAIRAKGIVSSPNASREQLEELCQYVQDTSPVRDSLVSPVSVVTSLDVV